MVRSLEKDGRKSSVARWGAVGDETEAKMDLVKRCGSKSVMVVLSHWCPIRGKYTATSRL